MSSVGRLVELGAGDERGETGELISMLLHPIQAPEEKRLARHRKTCPVAVMERGKHFSIDL